MKQASASRSPQPGQRDLLSVATKMASMSTTIKMRPGVVDQAGGNRQSSPAPAAASGRTSLLGTRIGSETPSTTSPTIMRVPATSIDAIKTLVARVTGDAGRSKRLRTSTIGKIAPRSSTTPSMNDGALGTAVTASGLMISLMRMMSSAYSPSPTWNATICAISMGLLALPPRGSPFMSRPRRR